MPWKEIARDWIANLTESYQADFLGVEKNNGVAVFELNKLPPDSDELALTFPCGYRFTGRPVWRRAARDSEKSRIGFYIHELGLSAADVVVLESATKARSSARIPMRLWAQFAEVKDHGTVTQDLSIGGCRLRGEHPELLGKTVKLHLDLTACPEPLALESRVVWSEDGLTGVQFVNLSTTNESVLLKTLGEATPLPSNFLPGRSHLKETNCYAIQEEDSHILLFLSVKNWDFRFQLEHALIKGEKVGCFSRFFHIESSEELSKLRTRLGVNLEKRKHLVHLYLLNDEDEMQLEVVGEEVWYERVRRTSFTAGEASPDLS